MLQKSWACSSVGRASALQAGGPEFESLQVHHDFPSRFTLSRVCSPADLNPFTFFYPQIALICGLGIRLMPCVGRSGYGLLTV